MAKTVELKPVRGYALTEVLLALAVFGLILLPLVNRSLLQVHDSINNYWQAVAVNQAQSMLERLRVNHSAKARQRELLAWNRLNQQVLPSGHGSFHCRSYDHHCWVSLRWWAGKKKQAYALGAVIV